jgi:hypothetical protein
MRGSGFTRRELLAVGPTLGLLGLAGGLAAALQGCGISEEARPDPHLVQALRELVGDADRPGRLAGVANTTPQAALRTLRGDLTQDGLDVIAADSALLRAHVERLRDADLAAGRLRYADGWLLADTEIAIAVLLGL